MLKDLEKKYFSNDTPKGWVDVNDYLPKFRAIDILKGSSEYRVKDKDGNEFISNVSDHNMWYYYEAKELNITHWFNN